MRTEPEPFEPGRTDESADETTEEPSEQAERLELDEYRDAEQQPLDWPREDPDREDPEHDTEPVTGDAPAGGPEEDALHTETEG